MSTNEQAKHNRESWLTEVARRAEPMFHGFDLGQYRVTCGWPSKAAFGRVRRVGECHSPKTSKAGIHELFVSPCLDDPAEVAGTLAHEMAHVAAGVEAGHGKGFIAVCRYVGLTKGRPGSVMPGLHLADRLREITDALGLYPHSAIVGRERPKVERAKTVLGLECRNCGCRVTISVKWLEESGYPVCGCGGTFGLRAGGPNGGGN